MRYRRFLLRTDHRPIQKLSASGETKNTGTDSNYRTPNVLLRLNDRVSGDVITGSTGKCQGYVLLWLYTWKFKISTKFAYLGRPIPVTMTTNVV